MSLAPTLPGWRLLALGALLAVGTPGPAAGSEWTITLAPFAGVLALDPHLRDYRWDVASRAAWGVAARTGTGRLAAGTRLWRASSTQSLGVAGAPRDAAVALTGLDLLAEAGVATWAGVRWLVTGSVGQLHIGYSPDRLNLDDGAGGTIDVPLDPISEWTAGVGVGLRRSLRPGWTAAASVERSWFALDTSHRAGTEIVATRETFGNWTARVELSRRVLPIGGAQR